MTTICIRCKRKTNRKSIDELCAQCYEKDPKKLGIICQGCSQPFVKEKPIETMDEDRIHKWHKTCLAQAMNMDDEQRIDFLSRIHPKVKIK